ncbi:MAG: redoxin family protein [Flavobacteriales bacterium]|nr:redoxin family protein [Flavobacteriales bacterium]
MKNKMLFAGGALSLVFAFAFMLPSDPETLALGAKAPNAELKMDDISGTQMSLNDLKKDNGLLVIFSCNTCPFVVGSDDSEGWEVKYAELRKLCEMQNIGMVLVNSNEAKREKGDNMADMKTRATANGFGHVSYVLDQNSVLADAFGARTTPHVFLFDKDLKLAYRGAIDETSANPKDAKSPYLSNAMSNMTAGKTIDPNDTRPMGCSIKRIVK